MKTFKRSLTVKNIIVSTISTLSIAIVVWLGMHFPALTPPSASADTFPISCTVTPTPTPIADGQVLPSLAYATDTVSDATCARGDFAHRISESEWS